MIPATLAIAAILVALLVMLVLLGGRRAEALLAPEIRRKVLHIAMGSVTLFLPFIFYDAAHVWWLAGLAFSILMIVRSVDLVKARIGGAIHTVGRNSFGELCFPLGVATLFTLSANDYLQYLVPMLILTFGDSLAALVGIYHGRQLYRTLDGHKTIEGSATLFGVSLLCVFLPYGLSGTVDLVPLLLVAINLALLITLVEAVTWRGIDNFVLPVIAFYLLDAYLPLDTGSLLSQALLNSTLVLAFLMLRRSRLAKE
jgi:phytol kinase